MQVSLHPRPPPQGFQRTKGVPGVCHHSVYYAQPLQRTGGTFPPLQGSRQSLLCHTLLLALKFRLRAPRNNRVTALRPHSKCSEFSKLESSSLRWVQKGFPGNSIHVGACAAQQEDGASFAWVGCRIAGRKMQDLESKRPKPNSTLHHFVALGSYADHLQTSAQIFYHASYFHSAYLVGGMRMRIVVRIHKNVFRGTMASR